MLKINGVKMPTPSSFSVDIQDIDGESERVASGDLFRERVAVKRKLSIEYPPLSMEESSKVLKSVSDVFFSVEYPDPMAGEFVTKTFYVGDRSIAVLSFINGELKWDGLKFNFIER